MLIIYPLFTQLLSWAHIPYTDIPKAQPKGGGRTRLVEPGQEQQGPPDAEALEDRRCSYIPSGHTSETLV